ncbi:hypothetical protein [Pendulispora albinea]|uniref:Uncharacterized protein n=1 Tax=Pendulispora albinea TaxID=2741071 RepID=A0ABZ2LUX9_9BACT
MVGRAARENRCKGTNFLDFLRILRQESNEDVCDECIARLPDELRDALRYGAIVRGGWYPIRWYGALHTTARLTGAPQGFARTVGRISTIDDLSGGIYSSFLRIVSPGFLISGAARLFNRYYELGTMDVLESRRGFVRVGCRGCVGFDANIWQDVLGGCEGGLQAARAHDLRIRLVTGGDDGDEHASIEAYFSEQ